MTNHSKGAIIFILEFIVDRRRIDLEPTPI